MWIVCNIIVQLCPSLCNSIAICMSVCLSVCVSVCPFAYLKTACQISRNYLYVLSVAVALSSSVGITLCTSGFVDDVMFLHNKANGRESETTRMFRRVRQAGSTRGRSLPSATAPPSYWALQRISFAPFCKLDYLWPL